MRANIYIKGLYLLNDIVLNIYKNVWGDVWYNTIINKVSYSFLIIERVGYIYIQDGNGEGSPKSETETQKDKIIKEYLGFLYFDYNMLPINDNKKKIIDKLKEYNNSKSSLQLGFIKTKIYVLNDLINILIKDPYVSSNDKIDLKEILNNSKMREQILEKKECRFLAISKPLKKKF